jgi:hypothetical protein
MIFEDKYDLLIPDGEKTVLYNRLKEGSTNEPQ